MHRSSSDVSEEHLSKYGSGLTFISSLRKSTNFVCMQLTALREHLRETSSRSTLDNQPGDIFSSKLAKR